MSVEHARASAGGAIAHASQSNVTASRRIRETDERWSAWMIAAQAGDRLAYESLLRSCIPLIKRVARRQGVWPDCIDDVVQETLLAIHRARQTYDRHRSFTAWLRTIAKRRAIDGLRRGRHSSAHEVHAPLAYENHPDSDGDSDATAFELDSSALLGAVRKLPVRQREAVNLLVFQNHSLPHAATATGRTAGSLRVSWHRAITTLRNQSQRELATVERLTTAEQGRQC
jgi:RNA polymerase sigma-70 factor (ECF subfamily)